MGSYCVLGKEKECAKARKEFLAAHDGKLPEKYKRTTLDSCMYCPSWMVTDDV